MSDSDDRKDWRQKEMEVAEGELVRRHHQLNGHELEQKAEETVEDRKLAGYSPRAAKCQTGLSDWTKTNNNRDKSKESNF